MAQDAKKRRVISYENMAEDLAAVFGEKYPKGFSDYLPDLNKYTKPDGTPFYAVTIEMEDAIYLVKIKVKIEDAEDLERWLDSESDTDSGDMNGGAGEGGSDGEALPDDNISQYGAGDEDTDV